MRRTITKIEITRLFERFDYIIDLKKVESGVVILTAPNGYGKSTILKIINSFATGDYFYFIRESFEKIRFSFSVGADVEIVRSLEDREKNQVIIRSEDKISKITDPFGEPNGEEQLFVIERALPFLTRVGPRSWRHDNSGERLDRTDILARYGSHPSIRRKFKRDEWLEEIRKSLKVFSIPTNRLKVDHERLERGEPSSANLMVNSIASGIKEKIDHAIRNQFEIGRKQETSFPTRLISSLRDKVIPTQESIIELIKSIQTYETRYSGLGLLPDASTTRQIANILDVEETAALLVLKTYLDDIREKFSLLDGLANKLDVFNRSINSLLAFNRIETSITEGIEIKPLGKAVGEKAVIPLSVLSSGEQHLIVLIGKLIFEADADTLILLDEPEISFHPEWQEQFLNILEDVRGVNNFSAIVATHSPILIGDRWDQVIELAEQVTTLKDLLLADADRNSEDPAVNNQHEHFVGELRK